MSVRGILTGSMALIVLNVITQDRPASQLSGLFGAATKIMQHLLSPDVAGISNRTAAKVPPKSDGVTGSPVPSSLRTPATRNATIGTFI
jgi:hypothetical protein